MPPAGGADRAFRRGVRIAAGFAAAIVVILMIVIVNRDHPLKWDTHPDPASRDNVQAGQNAPTDGSSVVAAPGKARSDLGSPN